MASHVDSHKNKSAIQERLINKEDTCSKFLELYRSTPILYNETATDLRSWGFNQFIVITCCTQEMLFCIIESKGNSEILINHITIEEKLNAQQAISQSYCKIPN